MISSLAGEEKGLLPLSSGIDRAYIAISEIPLLMMMHMVDIMPPVFRKPVMLVRLASGMWIRWLMWNVNCWHLGSFHFF